MPRETYDVVFRERGIRTIKRNLDNLGVAANNATRAIFLLQRAFFVIGGAGIARGLQTQLDQLTAYENRLRLTATSAANVEEIQDRLFLAANRSRTAFGALAEIYSRVALSVRELGVSQAETLRFTESLAKASIISGANAREANAALIQLGQGLASDRLSGDELRSVLEQLPFVAQIIADSLGVTRGELRELGREGKISAEEVLRAFRNSADEIDRLFNQLTPTIGQAFTILGNEAQKFLDAFDDATGASGALSNAIIALAGSLSALGNAAGVATIAALGFALDTVSKRAGEAIRSQIAFNKAIRSGDAVLLGSIQAEQQKTAATLAGAQANQAAAASTVARTQAQIRDTQARLAAAQAEVQATQFQRVGNQARILATGQYANLTVATANYERAVQRLNITQSLLNSQQSRLTAQQGTLAASTTALTAAQNASAASAARAATLTGRLALAYPVLTAAVVRATTALRAFGAVLLANPLTVILAAASFAAIALTRLRDATESVNRVADNNAEIFRGVKTAFDEAEESGKTLAETYDRLNESQLKFAETEALLAYNDAIAALSDSLTGFNSIATDLRTIVTADFGFASAVNTIKPFIQQFEDGQLTLDQFSNVLTTTATAADDPRFTKFTRELLDQISTAQKAEGQLEELRAVIAFLAGSADASQAALARMALGIDQVSNSANAASSAIDFFISQIPALARAQKQQGLLKQANEQLEAGLAGARDEYSKGNISLEEFRRTTTKLKGSFELAVSEIDGSAEKTRDLARATERYNEQADLASRTGLDRTLRRITIEYEGLVRQAKAAGASTEELAQIERNYQTLKAAARRDAAGSGGGGGGGSTSDPTLQGRVNDLDAEAEALRRYADAGIFANQITAIEKDLKRELLSNERELVENRLKNLEVAKTEAEILRNVLAPQQELEITQLALNNLLEQGAITLGQYNDKLRETQAAADAASGSLAGGFRSALSDSIKNASEFGSAIGNVVVGSIDKAADAIVEFAKTGKLNLRQLFQDLFAQLLKLAAQQLLLRFVGQLLGFPGGGIGGGPVGGGGIFGSIFGGSGGSIAAAASGGSISPVGPGSTDTRFVPLMTRPDERIDILTPQQQAQQRAMLRNGVNTQAPNVSVKPNIAVVLSQEDVEGAISDTFFVRAVERNKDSIRTVLS